MYYYCGTTTILWPLFSTASLLSSASSEPDDFKVSLPTSLADGNSCIYSDYAEWVLGVTCTVSVPSVWLLSSKNCIYLVVLDRYCILVSEYSWHCSIREYDIPVCVSPPIWIRPLYSDNEIGLHDWNTRPTLTECEYKFNDAVTDHFILLHKLVTADLLSAPWLNAQVCYMLIDCNPLTPLLWFVMDLSYRLFLHCYAAVWKNSTETSRRAVHLR